MTIIVIMGLAIQPDFQGQGWKLPKITTGEYFTRKGNKIDGIGLEPDIEIKVLPPDCIPDDIQLNKAIKYLATIYTSKRE